MKWDALIWLILLVVFILAEGTTVAMVSIWFALGSLIAILVSLVGGPVWLQILLFLVVSGVCLALLRPFARRYLHVHTRTNVESVIGMEGVVTETIDNIKACGRVKLGAMSWSARSISGETIEKDALVKVNRIEGVKVLVTPVKTPTNTK